MIKINLLDYRKERVRTSIQMEIAISLVLVMVTLGIIGFISSLQGSEIADLKADIDKKNRELASLKHVEIKVAESEKMQKRLENIVETITGLKKNQKEPAKLYDELINKRLPPGAMWLDRLDEQGQAIVLEGYAFQDSAISMFMESIEQMEKFSSVDLIYVRQKIIKKRKIKNFKINCVLKMPETI